MAGTMTHFEFMKELSSRIDFQGDKNLFLVAGQGHDLLYFIKLKEIKLFATRGLLAKEIASNKFREVVIAWQKEIIVTQNKDLEILLYGYIAHHILDSYIHPWLNNTCDCYFDKFDKKTWQNNGKHEMLESGLDMLINSPYKFKIPRVKIPVKTINSLNSIFKSVYNIKNIGFLLAKGINNMPRFVS